LYFVADEQGELTKQQGGGPTPPQSHPVNWQRVISIFVIIDSTLNVLISLGDCAVFA